MLKYRNYLVLANPIWKNFISDLKEIELKDIFSRSINWDTENRIINEFKKVMITGAGFHRF